MAVYTHLQLIHLRCNSIQLPSHHSQSVCCSVQAPQRKEKNTAALHDAQAEAGDDAAAAIARYLSLQNCLQGIGLVLRRALGVAMVPVSFRPGARCGSLFCLMLLPNIVSYSSRVSC